MNQADQHPECDCREILQLVLDGQASAEETERFRAHLQECPQCLQHYEVDAEVVAMLRRKCCGGPTPEDLEQQVRIKLNFRS